MTRSDNGMLSRRAVLGWGLTGVAAASTVGFSARAAALACSASAVPARPAEDLVSAFGVVTHFQFATSAYAQTDRMLEVLDDLGVRHVRNRIPRQKRILGGMSRLADIDVKVQGVCGAFRDPQPMDAVMRLAVSAHDEPEMLFSAFEAINEPNNKNAPWVAETRAKTRDLHAARQRHGLNGVPIVGPALARVNSGGFEGGDTRGQSLALGDLSDVIDYGNIHVYPRGSTPSTDLDQFIGYQRPVSGRKPIMTTEGGYFSADEYQGGSNPTPTAAIEQYVPRQLMENWNRGIERFFLYELLDDPDPTGAERESHFGMLQVPNLGARTKWEPKAHYYAMRNFLSILGDRGAPHATCGLDFTLQAPGTDVRSALVQKRNGVHYLLVWRDVSVYDRRAQRMDVPSAANVRIDLASAASVSVYDPASGPDPYRQLRSTRSVSLPVAGNLLICEIATHG